MADKKLSKDGLNKVWLKVMELVKSLTGNVDRTKGTLQEQVDELNSNLIIYDSFETSVTINANSDSTIVISDSYTIPNGYKIVGCIPVFRSSNGITGYATVKLINYNSNSAPNIIVNNSGSSSYTWTVECGLFMKKS